MAHLLYISDPPLDPLLLTNRSEDDAILYLYFSCIGKLCQKYICGYRSDHIYDVIMFWLHQQVDHFPVHTSQKPPLMLFPLYTDYD